MNPRSRATSCLIIVVAAGASACAAPPSEFASTSVSTYTECAAASPSGFEFEDDACHRKVQPANRARTLSCPIVSTNVAGFSPSGGPLQLDPTALRGIVPDDMKITAILVRRVDGVPYYHYMSNGTHDEAFQPWSASKFMAIAAAGASLREASGGGVGLTAHTGDIPLGDLATIVHRYDEDRFTSNGLSRFFLNVGGRARAQSLVSGWLARPANESYGGNYGMPAPSLPYTFLEASGASAAIAPDDRSGLVNHLSTFTLAEALKRLAVWDDIATRLPSLADDDVRTLLYGAANSTMYQGQMGGMSADLAIYVQNALDIDAVRAKSQDRFRIFSKLGFGKGEFVDVAYACLPVLDASGNPVPDEGAEFVVATRLATDPSASAWVESDRRLARIYERVVKEGILPRAQRRPGTTPPVGFVDAASCEGVAGWAQDPDAPDTKLDVHFYFDGPAGASPLPGMAFRADVSRPDLCGALSGSTPCDHAFHVTRPIALSPGEHTVYAYAIDAEQRGTNPLLGTKTFTCP